MAVLLLAVCFFDQKATVLSPWRCTLAVVADSTPSDWVGMKRQVSPVWGWDLVISVLVKSERGWLVIL
jgi:hypothetical protein